MSIQIALLRYFPYHRLSSLVAKKLSQKLWQRMVLYSAARASGLFFHIPSAVSPRYRHLSQICRFQLKSSHIILAGFLPAPYVELIPFACSKYGRNLHENVRDSHIWPPRCCRPHKVFEPRDMIAMLKCLGFFTPALCARLSLQPVH